ncbi:MAG: MazG nucleotide pyrophosphohydrolase domain-containing protein, partial [Bacillota bacterium]
MSTLTIAALSTPLTISVAALERCKNAKTLYVQTKRTPCVLPLTHANLRFSSMDDLYESAEDFDALNAAIADRLLAACKTGDAVYAVPGSGNGEALGRLALRAKETGVAVDILTGAGFAQAAMAAAGQTGDRLVVAAANSLPETLNPFMPLAVEELDTRICAGEVKLALLEYYPDEHPVRLCVMGEDGAYAMRELQLLELDRQDGYAATTVLFVPPAELMQLSRFGYGELERVMHRLRAPGGCPWDREQTHESLRKTMIEECYETIDAIDRKDDAGLCEELGD